MRPETVLAFDTSAAHCAAALLLPGGACVLRSEAMAKGQAERLLPLLGEILAEAGLDWQDLDAVAVGTGPGNFTGVRISVATARGLALSVGIPAIGVTRLEALAHGLTRPVTVIEDARRDEVYLQRFAQDGAGTAQLCPLADIRTDGPVTGSGAALLGLPALPAACDLAEATARIAADRIAAAARAGETGVIPRPAPFYLRGADAAPPSDPPPVILDA